MEIGIVEDNPITNDLLTTVFTMRGHHAFTFERGFDLLEAYKGKNELPFDALLVDLMLPGLSGIETVQALYQIMPSTMYIPLIFVTGAGHQEINYAQTMMPNVPIITKPFHYAEMLKILERIVREQST